MNRAAVAALNAASNPPSCSRAMGHPKAPPHVFTKTLSVNFRDAAGKVTSLELRPLQSIKEVKRMLAGETAPKGFGLLVDHDKLISEQQRQRLFYQGQVLKDSHTVNHYSIKHGDTVFQVEEAPSSSSKKPDAETKVEVVLGTTKCPPELRSVIEETQQGLASGMEPKLARSGLGGTYFLSDKDDRILGVFKPEDEEAYAPNNPRGLSGSMGSRGVRGGLLSGEANVREVAAYLLDHDKFANVPATVRVEVSHPSFGAKPKIGSFQEFKPHDEEAGDLSASLFTVEAAHRIAIMDIRLLNTDRNDENLLVKKSPSQEFELIPIDHGCSLPDSLEVNWHDWAWLSWPQSKQPLSMEAKAYIAHLDAERDSEMLSQELSIRWQCLLVLRVATTFLKLGAEADLSLYDIASMMSRDEADKPSVLEVVFAQAKTLAESKRRGGRLKRRSPPVSPAWGPTPTPSPQGTKLRRSASATDLCFDAFKLPGSCAGSAPTHASDDTGAWAHDDSDKEIFEETFWGHLRDLMSQAILRRQMKRRAVEQFKFAGGRSPSKPMAMASPSKPMAGDAPMPSYATSKPIPISGLKVAAHSPTSVMQAGADHKCHTQ